MTPAAADFVRFAWLLTCRWYNYIAKRFEALKTKNARKILRFRFFVVSLQKN